MKLRLWPVAISVVVSSVVLFGGWFLYDSLAMENPLASIASRQPGVERASVDITSDKVKVEVKLTPEANVRELYKGIMEQGSRMIGKRTVELAIANESSPELDRWWSEALFGVAEAMETGRYAGIPSVLEQSRANLDGLQVSAEMDETYVYVHLTDGQHHLYKQLPRKPVRIGVWPNE